MHRYAGSTHLFRDSDELSSEEILHTFGINEIGMVKAIVGQNWEAAIEDFYCQYKSLHNEVTSDNASSSYNRTVTYCYTRKDNNTSP